VLYYLVFLDHASSFATERNPLVVTTAAAPKSTAVAYPRGSSSKREDNYP